MIPLELVVPYELGNGSPTIRPDLTKVAASARESVQAPEVSGLTDVFDSRRVHFPGVVRGARRTALGRHTTACQTGLTAPDRRRARSSVRSEIVPS